MVLTDRPFFFRMQGFLYHGRAPSTQQRQSQPIIWRSYRKAQTNQGPRPLRHSYLLRLGLRLLRQSQLKRVPSRARIWMDALWPSAIARFRTIFRHLESASVSSPSRRDSRFRLGPLKRAPKFWTLVRPHPWPFQGPGQKFQMAFQAHNSQAKIPSHGFKDST